MNRFSILFAVCTLVLGATNVYLLWLQRVHAPSAAEGADDSMLRAEIESLKQDREQLEDELQILQSTAAVREYSRPCSTATSPAALPATSPGNAALRSALSGSMRPPELSLEQLQVTSRRRYGLLFRELELSDEQVGALLGVLASQEQRAVASRTKRGAFDSRGPEQPGGDDAERERNQAEIAGAIGADNAARFESLKQTLPARSELRQVRDQLEELGEPMSDEQHRALIAILNTRPPNPPPTRVDSESPEVGYERLRNWFSERDRRFREDSATVLTPQQLERLEESQSMRTAMSSMPASATHATNQARAGAGG